MERSKKFFNEMASSKREHCVYLVQVLIQLFNQSGSSTPNAVTISLAVSDFMNNVLILSIAWILFDGPSGGISPIVINPALRTASSWGLDVVAPYQMRTGKNRLNALRASKP